MARQRGSLYRAAIGYRNEAVPSKNNGCWLESDEIQSPDMDFTRHALQLEKDGSLLLPNGTRAGSFTP